MASTLRQREGAELMIQNIMTLAFVANEPDLVLHMRDSMESMEPGLFGAAIETSLPWHIKGSFAGGGKIPP